MEIILNEREWVMSAVREGNMGRHPVRLLNAYAIYLKSLGYEGGEIRRELEDFLLRCSPNANRVTWREIIDRAVAAAGSRPLVEVDGVWVTEAEMRTIAEIKTVASRKVMFALVCLARYRNAVREDNNNWVNVSLGDIFKMANVHYNSRRQALLINELWEAGYISFPKAVDNTSINVGIVDDSGKKALYVSDFRNLGNLYLLNVGDSYMECFECGAVVKRYANNQKYCARCAKLMHARRDADRRKTAEK